MQICKQAEGTTRSDITLITSILHRQKSNLLVLERVVAISSQLFIMSHPLIRGKQRNGYSSTNNTPSYGSIKRKTSPCSSIEEGQPLLLGSSSVGSTTSGAIKYPKATDEQRELLLLLEREIKLARNSKFQILLSELSEKKVQTLRNKINRVNPQIGLYSDGCDGFVFSFFGGTLLFLFLTLVLALCILIGIDVVQVGDFKPNHVYRTFLRLAFPCVAATLSFLSCLKPTMKRLTPFSQEVCSFASPSSLKIVAKEGIEEMLVMVASRIDFVNAKLTSVIENMRYIFERANRNQYKLRMVDPDLPEHMVSGNPFADVEREIHIAKEELHTSVLTFEQDISVDVGSWVPAKLSSPRTFYRRDVAATLAWLLFWHAVGTITLFLVLDTYLPRDLEVGFLSATTSFLARIPVFVPLSERLTPYAICRMLSFLLESYLVSSFFLLHVYFAKSSCKRTQSIINDLRSVVTSHTNWLLLQNGVVFLCHDILEVRMNHLRIKLTQLVDQNHKLCTALSLADIDDVSLSWEEDLDDNKKVVSNFPFQSPTATGGPYGYISDKSVKNSTTPNSVVSHQPSIDPPADHD